MSEDDSHNFDDLFRVAAVPAYHELIQSIEPRFPAWLVPSSALDLALLERLAKTLNVHDGSAVLDLACGGGGPALWVARHTGCTIFGVDGSPVGIETANALAAELQLTHRARFLRADATATGFEAGFFDAVMSIYALMFIDPHAAAREIARVLRPGGMVFVLTAESLVEPPPRPTMVTDYTPIFEAAGLEVLERDPIGDALWYAFFEGALGRADALREQAGADGQGLIDEATQWLETRAEGRSRDIALVARRKSGTP